VTRKRYASTPHLSPDLNTLPGLISQRIPFSQKWRAARASTHHMLSSLRRSPHSESTIFRWALEKPEDCLPGSAYRVRAFTLDCERPDVIRSLLHECPDNHRQLCCGFRFSMPNRTAPIDLSVRTITSHLSYMTTPLSILAGSLSRETQMHSSIKLA
jgi:hypothetical protein